MIPIGTEVEWTSQSQGSGKTKRGVVIAHLRPNQLLSSVIPAGTPRSRIKGSDWSSRRRYVVAVPSPSGAVTYYYAPVAEVLERAYEKMRATQAARSSLDVQTATHLHGLAMQLYALYGQAGIKERAGYWLGYAHAMADAIDVTEGQINWDEVIERLKEQVTIGGGRPIEIHGAGQGVQA